MPEMPAPMIRTSRCSRPVSGLAAVSAGFTTGILPAHVRFLCAFLPDRAAAAEHFAPHLGAVGELEVAAREEPPRRAGGQEQVLLLALVGPVPLDFEFSKRQRALTGDDRRDRDFGLGPVDAGRLRD